MTTMSDSDVVVHEGIVTRAIGVLRAQGDEALADELERSQRQPGRSAISTVWDYVSSVPGAVASQVNHIFGFGENEHRPQRRDDVEHWLMRLRTEYGITDDSWAAFDLAVKEYRTRADNGLSLSDELPTEDDDEEPDELMVEVGVIDLTEDEIPGEGAVLVAEVRTEEKAVPEESVSPTEGDSEQQRFNQEGPREPATEQEAIANANEGNVTDDAE